MILLCHDNPCLSTLKSQYNWSYGQYMEKKAENNHPDMEIKWGQFDIRLRYKILVAAVLTKKKVLWRNELWSFFIQQILQI